MTGPARYRLLATFIAGRSVEVAEAGAGEAAHTNGHVVFVTAGGSAERQRLEVLVQSALLAAGSLDQRLMKALRSRPSVAQRYLSLEGGRALAGIADRVALAAAVRPDGNPRTESAQESLDIARGRTEVAYPPEWFGAIWPSVLLARSTGPGARAADSELRLTSDVDSLDDGDDGDDADTSAESKLLKLFEVPLRNSRALSDFLRDLFGSSRSSGEHGPGGELRVGSIRRSDGGGPNARPRSTPIRFNDDGRPGAALGVGGAAHPEWDVFNERYRPNWCRVVEFPVAVTADLGAAEVPRDEVLRRRLSRVGLGPKVLRRRPDGDELDIEALIELAIDLRSGYSPAEHVYLESRKLTRDLGVLILLDCSGSATDTDSDGLAVHEHQRRAAATLAAALTDLGDRVAVYGFRSHGRHAVHLLAVKTFSQRFGAMERTRLHRLQPSGYTRLGAGIRGAGELLKTNAGTPNRLLLVLSDGFPYDDGYEGRYAEADTSKAIEELRTDGIACLCLSIGAGTVALERVFGSSGHASAATLAELSPRMDDLFVSSLRELAAPRPRRRSPNRGLVRH